MGAPGEDAQAGAASAARPGAHVPPEPDLKDSIRQLGTAAQAGLGASKDAFKAFRTLVSADVALARSAMGRALAFTSVAVVFGASGWLLLMTLVVVLLTQQLHWPWWGSLLSTGLLSIVFAIYAGWKAMEYFEHTRMRATRRQLARLGFGELADYTPDPGSPESTREATERLAEQGPVKDERGIDVTPP